MNKIQNYNNHVRYYTMHHFIFYPIIVMAALTSIAQAVTHPDSRLEWIAIACMFLMLAWLSFILRQHYALINQNRIVRLELRFRYYLLTQQRFEFIEPFLSFPQLASLRFASDEELPTLVQRTIKEQLSADAIKKSIQHWMPDHMRV